MEIVAGWIASVRAWPLWSPDIDWGPKRKLALTAYLQVALVAMNTVYIAQGNIPAAFLTSYGISHLWTLNVARVAIGNALDRFCYAFGAACGCVTGLIVARAVMGMS